MWKKFVLNTVTPWITLTIRFFFDAIWNINVPLIINHGNGSVYPYLLGHVVRVKCYFDFKL